MRIRMMYAHHTALHHLPLYLNLSVCLNIRWCATKTSLSSQILLYFASLQCIFMEYHHHYVPSVVNRSAVMDLHHSRSCATLMQSLYDIFVHSLMLSVHIVLGLLRPMEYSNLNQQRLTPGLY